MMELLGKYLNFSGSRSICETTSDDNKSIPNRISAASQLQQSSSVVDRPDIDAIMLLADALKEHSALRVQEVLLSTFVFILVLAWPSSSARMAECMNFKKYVNPEKSYGLPFSVTQHPNSHPNWPSFTKVFFSIFWLGLSPLLHQHLINNENSSFFSSRAENCFHGGPLLVLYF